MALGTLVYYFGVAAIASSFRSLLAVLVFAVFLLAYIKLIEEREMSVRFGEEYSRYRRSTPFIVPRIPLLKRAEKARLTKD